MTMMPIGTASAGAIASIAHRQPRVLMPSTMPRSEFLANGAENPSHGGAKSRPLAVLVLPRVAAHRPVPYKCAAIFGAWRSQLAHQSGRLGGSEFKSRRSDHLAQPHHRPTAPHRSAGGRRQGSSRMHGGARSCADAAEDRARRCGRCRHPRRSVGRASPAHGGTAGNNDSFGSARVSRPCPRQKLSRLSWLSVLVVSTSDGDGCSARPACRKRSARRRCALVWRRMRCTPQIDCSPRHAADSRTLRAQQSRRRRDSDNSAGRRRASSA